MRKFNLNLLFFMLLLNSLSVFGQNAASERIKFDPKRNPNEDLKSAVTQAQPENKRIILDIGGEWCIWCHRLDAFIEENTEIKSTLEKFFIVVKVNYSEENKNEAFLKNYPKVPGFPHMFVLESNGKFLHSQDTGKLEKGKSYDAELILKFLNEWKKEK